MHTTTSLPQHSSQPTWMSTVSADPVEQRSQTKSLTMTNGASAGKDFRTLLPSTSRILNETQALLRVIDLRRPQ